METELNLVILVMGVCGSGKTTIGRLLAQRLNATFVDADDFHSTENINKMSRGQALNDEDRWPWLDNISNAVREHKTQAKPVVLACSALKQSYRDRFNFGPFIIVFLHGTHKELKARLSARHHHFMSVQMLDKQLETLEAPNKAICISIKDTPENIVNKIISAIG